MPAASHPPLRSLAAALTAFLLFAGAFIVSKHGVQQGLTAYDIAALRFGVAGVLALPLLIRWGIADLAGVTWRRGVVLAALVGAPGFTLMIAGLSFAPAANLVVINPGMTLIGGTLLSVLWLGERSTPWRLIAGAIAIVGLVLIGGRGLADPSDHTWIGSLIFAVSGLVWAVYMTLLHRWRIDPVRAAVLVATLSLIYLPVYALAVPAKAAGVPWPALLLQAGYQGVLHGLVAMAVFAYAVRRLGAGLVALMTPIVPVTGLVLAVLLLGERLTPWQWLGAALVCSAMLLAASRPRPLHAAP